MVALHVNGRHVEPWDYTGSRVGKALAPEKNHVHFVNSSLCWCSGSGCVMQECPTQQFHCTLVNLRGLLFSRKMDSYVSN